MEPVGQASNACNACRRSALDPGWALTKEVARASPNTAGAIWRQASQSMQVESTKKSPGTFSGTRLRRSAITHSMFNPVAGANDRRTRGRLICRARRLLISRGMDYLSPEGQSLALFAAIAAVAYAMLMAVAPRRHHNHRHHVHPHHPHRHPHDHNTGRRF